MNNELKEFHLGDILSVTTGFLMPPNGMGGIYDILNYMTGDDLFTHALPRAADECKPYLLEQMPFLSKIDGNAYYNSGGKDWDNWLADKIATYGEYHSVRPIHFEDHEVIDPIEELHQMGVDDSKIIQVDMSNDDISPTGDINWKVDSD